MKITQARVSESISFFAERFHRKFALGPYIDSKRPCIFFGCYHWRGDANLIMAHRSLAVVIWTGSDILKAVANGTSPVLSAPHVRHVAISEFTARDLGALGVTHVRLPVAPADPEVWYSRDIALGRSVYVYTSHTNPRFYGLDVLQEVQRELIPEGINFILGFGSTPNFSRHELVRIYAESCVGLRLTKHDGLPNTVVELGLMGRRSIHNDPTIPGTIPWRGPKDVCASIRRECAKAGTFQPRVADEMKRFLSLPPDWLTTEFYDDPASRSR